jgi:hypothetical protein
MAENNGLPRAPVFKIDCGSVLGIDRVHESFEFRLEPLRDDVPVNHIPHRFQIIRGFPDTDAGDRLAFATGNNLDVYWGRVSFVIMVLNLICGFTLDGVQSFTAKRTLMVTGQRSS